jgi:vancomycin aglycone glucosyltransferase
MRILLATYGSRGDVQPLLALAVALEEAGHEVVFAAPPERAPWLRAYGFAFHALGRDFTAFLDRMACAHSPAAALRFVSFLRKELPLQFDRLEHAIEGADLALGSSLAFALATVAELRRVPYRFIAFTPQLIPSGAHPFMAFQTQGLPAWWNRATWRMISVADRFNLTRLINRCRRERGLPPVRDAWRHILGPKVIVASDRAVGAVPPDAGIPSEQTGYLHLEQPDVSVDGLEAFLASGRPPVYAGFGSMPGQDQPHMVPMLVRAARAVDRRIIIGRFREGSTAYDKAQDVFFLKGYPHLKLFPRMAAVIHHGGAGTTATCAVSGVPQVIVPHVLDQHYWGHRVWLSGLGPRPIRRSALRVRALSNAVQCCVSDERVRERAGKTAGVIDRRISLALTVHEIGMAASE